MGDGPWPDIPMGDPMGGHPAMYPQNEPMPMHSPYPMDHQHGAPYQGPYQGQFPADIDPFERFDSQGNANKAGAKGKKNKVKKDKGAFSDQEYRSYVEERYEGWDVVRKPSMLTLDLALASC